MDHRSATDGRTRTGGDARPPVHRFKLNYAGRLGKFPHLAGDDPIDQIKFMADQGFRALEDSHMQRRPVELQSKIADALARLDMQMGTFIASAHFDRPTFASGDKNLRRVVLDEIRAAVDVAKRLNARWFTVVPGVKDDATPTEYQTAYTIDTLRYCCDICESAEMIMVLEPLNSWVDHPRMFLQTIPQAYLICRAVSRPSCKILDDLYHQQISEGNLLGNLDRAWDEIAYIQVGGHPGRNEPTTGEINYKNVFRYIYEKGYDGLVGMEHGSSLPGRAGEQAVIDAYVEVDGF